MASGGDGRSLPRREWHDLRDRHSLFRGRTSTDEAGRFVRIMCQRRVAWSGARVPRMARFSQQRLELASDTEVVLEIHPTSVERPL